MNDKKSGFPTFREVAFFIIHISFYTEGELNLK